jgi:choline dehydrogenase-like flavoprotein
MIRTSKFQLSSPRSSTPGKIGLITANRWPRLGGRRDYLPRGKVLGRSSSINAMIFQRGHPANYDGWAAFGNNGWAWRDVLPFFKKWQDQGFSIAVLEKRRDGDGSRANQARLPLASVPVPQLIRIKRLHSVSTSTTAHNLRVDMKNANIEANASMAPVGVS